MWLTILRIALAISTWSALAAVARAAGISASTAEVAGGLGAGVTLVAWAVALKIGHAAPAETTGQAPAEAIRQRASV